MPITWKAWTVKDMNRVMLMYFEGSATKEIAVELGRSYGAVKSLITRRKKSDYEQRFVNSKRLTRRQHQFIAFFRKEHDHREIAEKMGVKVNTSKTEKYRLTKMGFEFPPAKNICRKKENNRKRRRIVKKQPSRYRSRCGTSEGYQKGRTTKEIYRPDQEHFILKMGELVARIKKEEGRYPTDAEVFQESLRIGYRKVNSDT